MYYWYIVFELRNCVIWKRPIFCFPNNSLFCIVLYCLFFSNNHFTTSLHEIFSRGKKWTLNIKYYTIRSYKDQTQWRETIWSHSTRTIWMETWKQIDRIWYTDDGSKFEAGVLLCVTKIKKWQYHYEN